MAAGSTYEPIQTYTLGSAQSSISFTSIPQTYTDLVLTIQLTTAAATNMRMRFNSNIALNYSTTHFDGTGSSVTTFRETTENGGLIDYNAAYPNGGSSSVSNYTININNYLNTTLFKSWLSTASNSTTGVSTTIGLWRVTNAINAIQIYTSSGGNMSIGSTFTLYGIAAA